MLGSTADGMRIGNNAIGYDDNDSSLEIIGCLRK